MDAGPSILFEDLNKDLLHRPKVENNNNEYSVKYDSISAQVEEIIGELDVPSNTELEIELRRKEKELYLCSKLGLFLLQEVNELTTQKHDLLKDHTKVLLDLQSYHYQASKDEVFDGEINSEYPELEDSQEIVRLKTKFEANTTSASNHLNRLESLQNEVFSFNADKVSSSPISFPNVESSNSSQKSTVSKSSAKKVFKDFIKKRKSKESPITTIDEMKLSKDQFHRSGSVDSLTEVQSVAESTMTTMSMSKNLQTNLDKLQIAHERITRLELHLDATRAKYRSLMTEYSQRLKEISKNLGTCVERARPYFETVAKARKAQVETQQAAMQYKRASNLQKVARDMVKVAEERLFSSSDRFDTTWQEMLNQATVKVNDASREKDRIHHVHMEATKAFKLAEQKREKLQSVHERNIVKSKPYYEVQQDFQLKLEAVTKRLNTLEVRLLDAKQRYSSALTEISKTGNDDGSLALKSLAERGMGVGAENPVLEKFIQENERRLSIHKSSEAIDELADKNNLENESKDLPEDVLSSKRFNYNPYDLMYLNQADAAGNSGEEYIQDF